jgi:Cd2+/Zn2+-exporting ATPase
VWKRHATLAVAALALLLVALVLPDGAPRLAVLLAATAAGLWFPLREAASHLWRGHVDVDFLMLLVAIGAWLLGHPEEGVFLLVLFGASRAMEAWGDDKTQDAVASLMLELPEVAVRIDADGSETTVKLEDLLPAMRIALRPGERVPVDVRILEGTASIDSSSMTGESYLLEAGPGTEVPSGAVNLTGSLIAEVLRPAGESAYQKIIFLVRSAPAQRSPAQVLGERVGRIYTAIILSATVIAFLVWWGLARMEFQDAAYRALVLLVAGSPCALVLSIPSAVLAGIAAGARRGILFHGGRGLLAVARIRGVAFDKTGTLTTGEPSVIGTTTEASVEHLAIARDLANQSNHPASRAVAAWLATRRDLPTVNSDDVHEIAGNGIQGQFDGKLANLGRSASPISPTSPDPTTWLSIDGQAVVGFRLRETIRPGTANTMQALVQRGLKLMVVSGDKPFVVERLAKSLGIERAEGGLLPEQKHELLRTESAKAPIMMVGDGVNDAAALAAADVGASMGIRGSAATIAQADLVLARDDIRALVDAVDIGRRTRKVVLQNIVISVGAATILVSLALIGILPLSLGVLGHEGGTVLVVLNSLRLLAMRNTEEPQARAMLGAAANQPG